MRETWGETPSEDTVTHRESHVTTEAEAGVRQLRVKEGRGLPATPETGNGRQGRILPRVS